MTLKARHLLFQQQVIHTLMDMAEPVYLLPGQVGGGGSNPIILRVLSHIEGRRYHIRWLFQSWVISPNTLTTDMNIRPHSIKPFAILL
jgi:hypothetical protein